MDQGQVDRHLWEAVVAAEQQVTRRRAEFYRDATARREILAAALCGSNWERKSALSLLQSLHEDVPKLLDRLIDLAISDAWALSARHVIAAGRRDVVLAEVDKLLLERLPTADATDYRRLAELLVSLEAWDILQKLVQRARTSDDPETNEVDRDFSGRYGPMLAAP